MMATYSDIPQELEDQYEIDSYDEASSQKNLKKIESFEDSFPALPSVGKAISNKPIKAYKFVTQDIIENFSIPSHDLKKEVIGGSKTSDVCRKVKQNIPVQIDLSIQKKSGTVTIILKGKESDVKAAKREICSGICTEVVETLPFPLSVRKHILGTQGSVIKGIMTETKTNIEMPPRPQNESELDEDEEQIMKITGDKEGVELAKDAIEKLINKHANRYRLTIKVPRSYHIFIAGPDNTNLQLIQSETGARVRIPPYIVSEKMGNPEEIVITGSKVSANEAYEKIERIYKELERKTDKLVFTCNKKQHRFIVGPKGKNLQKILQETGCSVELPLPKEKNDQIIIRGPPEKLPLALKLITEMANSQFIEEVKISTVVANPMDYRLFRKCLFSKEWQNIKAIEKKYDVMINIRENQNNPDILEVNGKNKENVENAEKEFVNLIKKCKTYAYDIVEIPHGIHSHIIGKNGQNLNKIKVKDQYKDKIVDIIVPSEKEESDEIIVVVDGKAMTPSMTNTLLEQVKKEISDIADKHANMITQTIDIDPKYHGSLIGVGGSAIEELKSKYNSTLIIKFPKKDNKAKMASSLITVTGPQKDVTDAIADIKASVEAQKHIDFMNKFSETVTVGKGIGRRVVGGAHVQNWLVEALKSKLGNKFEITEEILNMMRFDIDEQNDEDIITCTGHRNVIPTAVQLIAERSKEILDTVTVEINVLNKYHSLLIGTKGKNINEIKQKYNVQFFFPEKINSDDEDFEEKSKSKDRNKITIKGFKNDVEKAKKVVLDQVQDIIDHSYEITFKVPVLVISKIVGRKGAQINKMKQDTDTRIDIDETELSGGDEENEEVSIVIRGTKKGCDEAKKQIMKIVKESTIVLSRDIVVPRNIHRTLNTRFRSHMDALINKYSDKNERVRLNFPYGFEEGDELNKVVLRAPKETINEACEAFEKLVQKVIDDVNNRISVEITVPRRDLARIVGTKGSNINEVSRKYEVSIDMNRDFTENEDIVPITISGLSLEKIEGAKKEILEKSSKLISVPVTPMQIAYLSLDTQLSQRRQGGNSFIEFGKEKINIHGDQKNAEEMKKVVDKKLEEIKECTVSKKLIIDRSICPMIIGRNGSNINRIRDETNCKIAISSPKGNEDKATVIILAKDNDTLEAGVKAIETINHRREVETSMKISIPNHLHGRIIGVKGKNVDTIKKEAGKSVRINFPPRNRKDDTIEVTGEKNEVKKCIELLQKNAEELKKELGEEDEDSANEASSVTQNEESSRTPVPSNNNQNRRIPGFSGEKKKINILKSSDVIVDELATAMNYLGIRNYQAPHDTKKDNEWQVIESKNKKSKATTEEESEAAVESSASKKKKNKKKNKKKKAAEAAALEQQSSLLDNVKDEVVVEEEEVVVVEQKEVKEEPKKKKKNKKNKNKAKATEEAAAVVEEKVAAPAPSQPQSSTPSKSKKSKSSPPVAEVPKKEEAAAMDDEWISIPKKQTKSKKNNENADSQNQTTSSVNTFANLNEDDGEKKKKKKKRNKKKSTNNE